MVVDSGFETRGEIFFLGLAAMADRLRGGVKKLNGKRLMQDGRWPQLPSTKRITT
jgi:hypothetical protein